MKRFFLLVSLISIPLFMFSNSIIVDYPSPGAPLEIGGSYMIKWTKSGSLAPNVKINIFKNAIAQPNFVEQLTGPNSGKLSWTVSAKYVPGNYILRIKTDDNKVTGDSKVFIIKTKSGDNNTIKTDPNILSQRTVISRMPQLNQQILQTTPAIGVSEPKQSSVVIPYAPFEIKWKGTGVMSGRVRIDAIFQSSKVEYFIASNISNNGLFKWEVYKASWNPGDYVIRVQTMDGKVTGTSGVFRIGKKPAPAPNLSKLRSDFLILINNYRKSMGKNALVLNTCLNTVAQAHSEWMYSTDIFKHVGRNGSTPWDRCNGAGCHCDAENIYMGAANASSSFNSWKNSPDHNTNMLGYHTMIGIGVSGGYWTTVFE